MPERWGADDMTLKQDRSSPFHGTAWYYSRYRPGVPAEVIKRVVDRFGLDGSGRCIDLGCGTGQLTFALADHFEETVGFDPDRDMLVEAQSLWEARKRAKPRIRWQQRPAEGIVPDDGPFRLATMSRAFVWMDQTLVLNLLKDVLVPGGGIAIVGDGSFWSGRQDWQKTIKATVQKFLGEQRRAGAGLFKDHGIPYTEMLATAGYTDVLREDLPIHRDWTFEELVGCLYSTSFAARGLFENRIDEFEKELFSNLGKPKPADTFREETDFTIQSGFWRT